MCQIIMYVLYQVIICVTIILFCNLPSDWPMISLRVYLYCLRLMRVTFFFVSVLLISKKRCDLFNVLNCCKLYLCSLGCISVMIFVTSYFAFYWHMEMYHCNDSLSLLNKIFVSVLCAYTLDKICHIKV